MTGCPWFRLSRAGARQAYTISWLGGSIQKSEPIRSSIPIRGLQEPLTIINNLMNCRQLGANGRDGGSGTPCAYTAHVPTGDWRVVLPVCVPGGFDQC